MIRTHAHDSGYHKDLFAGRAGHSEIDRTTLKDWVGDKTRRVRGYALYCDGRRIGVYRTLALLRAAAREYQITLTGGPGA
jgi:hypothetical protein